MVTRTIGVLDRTMIRRAAFTMIELIFAIVVIGVTVLTVPLMIETNNRSLEGSLDQEAIFLASAALSLTTTLVWDNRSIVSTATSDDYVLAKVLDVGAVGSTYGRTDVNSTLRIGGIREDKHRQFFDYNESNISQYTPIQTGDASLAFGGDIDPAALGLKQAYNVVISRGYVNDGTNSFDTDLTGKAPTNLKMTKIEIYGEDTELISVLRAYTANIGEVDYESRSF